MSHVLLLNLVFFIPATCGAGAFAFLVYRFVSHGGEPPADGPGGMTSPAPPPSAGPDDLARSA